METTSIKRLNQLHPKVRQSALDAYAEAVRATPVGIHPLITETLRSFERSTALYNQPWDKKDNDGDGKIDEADEKVSNAKAGQSLHNYGVALDFVIMKDNKMNWSVDKDWMTVVNIFKKYGWSWGGDWKSFKDYPHLEKTNGYTWQKLLALKNAGKVDKDGYVII